MKIAVVNITSGGLSGGYRKYLRSVMPRIARDNRVSQLDVFMPPGVGSLGELGCDTHAWPDHGNARITGIRTPLAKLDPNLVFIPTARWMRLSVPTITMIRNMEPLVIPFAGGTPLEIARNLARRTAARRSVKNSDGVIAVSSYVADFLRQRWQVPISKTAVVYHGVDKEISSNASNLPRGLSRLINMPFLFTAGSIRPARGLSELIQAFAQVRTSFPRLHLVIAGGVDSGMNWHQQSLITLAAKLGCTEAVTWLGAIEPGAMAWAYQNCTAFIMSSHVEACPNTALEALANGCLCVSTDVSPMPEMFGDCAEYYSGGDATSLATAVNKVLGLGDPLSRSLRSQAEFRATDFTWDRTATRTIDFFEAVLKSRIKH